MPLKCLAVASIFLFSLRAPAQSSPPIPAAYQSLYTELQGDITSFSQVLSTSGNGSSYPTLYSSQLLTASSNNDTSLIGSTYYVNTVLPELQELQALGVGAVTVHINFPTLYEPYYGNQQEYQQFVSFYQQLQQQIHSMGMKMTVETTVNEASPGTNGGDFQSYYATLSWNQYVAGRAQNAVNIAQLIQPDFLSVITEPDSEGQNSGQPTAGTTAGNLQELQTIIAALQAANVTNVPIGAGAGTWIPSFTTYIQNAISTPISYVDTHFYSVSNSFPENALTAASMAHAAGLQVAMSEAWCKKVSASQLTSILGALNDPTVDALGTFSFWEPVDESFLQTLVTLGQVGQFEFISPFWDDFYFAYLDYAQDGTLSASQQLIDVQAAAATARGIGAFSPVGTNWETLILPARDTTAPQVPSAPTIGQYSQTQVQVLWTPTTDNVGVAGYNLFRNGKLLTTASQVNYFDNSVSPSTTYSYQLQAFDASANVSALSAAAMVTTRTVPDTTPPSVPKNVQGVGVTDQQNLITWSPSTDNVAVGGYRVFRGTTMTSLSTIASVTTNSLTDTTGVSPSTTYYYAIEAFDTSYNYSAQSAIVSVNSLPDKTPPTVPTNIVATGTGLEQINLSWSPATDDYHLSGYSIFRGTTASSLVQVGNASTNAFVDTKSLNPGTTYYYAIEAYDSSHNYSAQSSVVTGTTLADTQPPSVPQNLVASPQSETQINLTWSPSTDNVLVAGYDVFRGTSASSLSLLAVSTATSFMDNRSIAPGATYYYAIEAFDSSHNYSVQSKVVAASSVPDTIPPTTPATLTAAGTGYEQVSLSWSASTDNYRVAGYSIYRGVSASALVLVGGTAATTYVDNTGLLPGKTYYYAVAAYDVAKNYSPQTSPVTGATFADTQPPSVPQNLMAVAVGGTQISLTWSPSTDNVGVSSYRIYRGITSISLTLIASSTTASYKDSASLKSGQLYYYAVAATDSSGNMSAQSTIVSITNPQVIGAGRNGSCGLLRPDTVLSPVCER